ncbi:MAG: ABC transporter permease [Mycobacteriaceae bacterium]
MSTQTTPKYSRSSAIGTVTQREIQVAMKNKGLIATFIIMFVGVIVGVVLLNVFSGDDSDNPELVVTGTESSLVSEITGDSVDVNDVDDRDAAVSAVEDGKDAALVYSDANGFELISDGEPDPAISAGAQAAASTIAQNEALTSVGVDPEEFSSALPDATLNTVDLSSDSQEDENLPGVVVTMIGTAVLLTFIMTFAGNVGGRVTEEKSSRVVEIILATIRPMDLLVGKVLAMLVVGFVCTAVILVAAFAGLGMTGMLDEFSVDAGTVVILLVAYILGMLFFSSLYAAAGALVSKAEDLNSTQTPAMILWFAALFPPFYGFAALDSTIMQVLAWIPPMSMGVAPMQYAAGNWGLATFLASYAVFAVATVLIMLLVARIYRGSILNNGKRMSWMAAINSGAKN